MSNPLARLFPRLVDRRSSVEAITPRRTFQDVVLPPVTRRLLDDALTQVHSYELIFTRWGLGERHPTGTALAFNFAGPSGTGKTICAEAIAHALGKRLLLVRYSEMESMWFGETPKNVAAVFRLAEEEDAVLFFDEADAIASSRSTDVSHGQQREANTVVNVLLQELERFDGVVIFATNLAANFDPAFERRIRTHVLFELPGVDERERIWEVQLHRRTPVAEDVSFRDLAEAYAVSGGDIRNAVLRAALAAAAEPGPDDGKRIHQHHFVRAMEDVLAGKRVMTQSIIEPNVELRRTAEAVAQILPLLAQMQARTLISVAVAGAALLTAMTALILLLS
ncbi:MAG: ATP-binding protein [Gemmatimonadetes bacterium]|nr:ATP-binding protein [Gemmatimonadota bacterium]